MYTHTAMATPIGELILVNRDERLAGVYFEDHLRMPDPAGFGRRDAAGFEQARRQLSEYFAGERLTFSLDLDPPGNAFQHRVWALLRSIPYGQTRTYGALAANLGNPGLARAVGSAGARNPLSIVVGCHRVLGTSGSLTGYAGGLERKRWLLDHEAKHRFAGQLSG